MKFSSCSILLSICVTSTSSTRTATAFSVPTIKPTHKHKHKHNNAAFVFLRNTRRFQSTEAEAGTSTSTSTSTSPYNSPDAKINMPLTFNQMIQEASDAMTDASSQGINRQIIRVLLPRDPNSGNLGQYFEEDVEVDNSRNTQELLLAPPDESWQGGIMQLYRAAAPTCKEILRRVGGDVAGVPPKLIEDRSVDESGVDGVGLLMTQSNDPKNDISCFVQPLQETMTAIETISGQAGDRLCVLMNPQWRNVDDALDSASKQEGTFLGSLATFLGGKGTALKRLEDAGYKEVFTIEGYVCKGGNVRLLKRFDTEWAVFAENDSETDFIFIGNMKVRPTYQDVESMLDDKGVSLKYARDIGLAPKLE